MNLDEIVASYRDKTLADKPDLELSDAMNKVAAWHDWRTHHPESKPDAVPPASLLKDIYDFLLTLTTRRYGCND